MTTNTYYKILKVKSKTVQSMGQQLVCNIFGGIEDWPLSGMDPLNGPSPPPPLQPFL